MQEVLFEYRLNPTTWAYLSSLLTIGIFFKFHRLWSVRNLDLVGLIALTPGLLLLYHGLERRLAGAVEAGQTLEQIAYIWLFTVGALFLVRLLLDPIMVRRPLLEPNLSAGGLTFTCIALLVFLMANVVMTQRAERLEDVLPRVPAEHGPGYPPFYCFANYSAGTGALPEVAAADAAVVAGRAMDEDGAPPDGLVGGDDALARLVAAATSKKSDEILPIASELPAAAELSATDNSEPSVAGLVPNGIAEAVEAGVDKAGGERKDDAPCLDAPTRGQVVCARIVAVLAQVAIVVGLVLVGFRHFSNIQTGVAVASLYLLVFYTSQLVARVDHVLPAALLIWAIALYRRPVVSGLLLGLAGGLIYYPLFLLPLWSSFYWRRGLIRFGIGVSSSLLVLVIGLAFSPPSLGSFVTQLQLTLGWMNPLRADLAGFWQFHPTVFRIPVLAAFVALSASFAIWPAQKNLGTLLSCSAAVMLSSQFWQAYQGGIHMNWYLPLLLLTIFRPNLEDRIAVSAVSGRAFPRGQGPSPAVAAAASPK